MKYFFIELESLFLSSRKNLEDRIGNASFEATRYYQEKLMKDVINDVTTSTDYRELINDSNDKRAIILEEIDSKYIDFINYKEIYNKADISIKLFDKLIKLSNDMEVYITYNYMLQKENNIKGEIVNDLVKDTNIKVLNYRRYDKDFKLNIDRNLIDKKGYIIDKFKINNEDDFIIFEDLEKEIAK